MTVDELNAITAQFGELFKQYLTNPIFRRNIDLLMKIPIKQLNDQNVLQALNLLEDKYQYELRDSNAPWKPNILTVDEFLDVLLSNSESPPPSFCRIGDGECAIIGGGQVAFQEYDATLADKLRKILEDDQSNCYVGIPRHYWYPHDYPARKDNSLHARYDTLYVPASRSKFNKYCNKNKIYIDAHISAYIEYKNSLDECEAYFAKFKRIFKDKSIAIFAGETVFKDLKHDIFSEAAEKVFVSCPRTNAWRVYDKIIAKALSFPAEYILCFILGPTATVAAYELTQKGYTAWDIGHLAKDYDAFMKQTDRSPAYISKFMAPD